MMTLESLLDTLPDAAGLRRAASILRANGEFELGMTLQDAARFVALEEREAQLREMSELRAMRSTMTHT